jgi:hypothetical protein
MLAIRPPVRSIQSKTSAAGIGTARRPFRQAFAEGSHKPTVDRNGVKSFICKQGGAYAGFVIEGCRRAN